MLLDEFNAMPESEARDVVGVWAAVPSWVDAVVEARPYATTIQLARHAAQAAVSWTTSDLDAALAHHPRIGDRVRGEGAEAAASRSEQSSMVTATDGVAERIAAGNAAYEARFGRVFLIRAAGRSPEEMLAALERRLGQDEDAEAREATAQLAEIALLRLDATVTANSPAMRERLIP